MRTARVRLARRFAAPCGMRETQFTRGWSRSAATEGSGGRLMALSDLVLAPRLPATAVAGGLARRPTRAAAVVAFCRRNPLVLVGASVVLVWIVIAVGAPLIAPYGPLTQRVVDRLKPPTAAHLFGTDALGRDILSRVL